MSTCIVAWYIILSATAISPGLTSTKLTPVGFTDPMSCEYASNVYRQEYQKSPNQFRVKLESAGTHGYKFGSDWVSVNGALMASPIKD
jgi:hypothetical protein